MVITDVLKNLDENSPPFQPFIGSAHVVSYEEQRIEWNPVSIKKDALFYQFCTGDQAVTVELLPDACLNILFACDDKAPTALFSGTFLGARKLTLQPNTQYFGCKPYSILGMYSPNLWLGELVDTFEHFTDAFPDTSRLLERLILSDGLEQRIGFFNEYAKNHLIDPDYIPGFVDYFTVMICSARGSMLFNNLESVTGYSERYCREKFKAAYGLSPKKYSNIMRFQNVLKGLVSGKYQDLASLAFSNGYFDQAHFIHDFKKFTAVSPQRFKRNYRNMCEQSCG